MQNAMRRALPALALLVGCHLQTRAEPARMGWAHRSGGHWAELSMGSVEVGPGGPRAQSVTVAATSRILAGRDDEGRLEGAAQVRFHLWRRHREHNLWQNTSRPFDANDPNLRRIPCGQGFHTQRYDGRAYTEAFSVGALIEGFVAGHGRWVPNGVDRYGRPQKSLSDLQLDGGFAAGVFARALTTFWLSLNLDAGWEHAYGASGFYTRVSVGLPLDLSVDRTQPRLEDDP